MKVKKKVRRSLSKLFERADIFIRDIKPNDKITIIYDSDPDGVCSAAIAITALREVGINNIFAASRSPDFVKKYGARCTFSDKTIILDLSTDIFEKDLPKMKTTATDKKFLIFDHHLVWKIKSKNVTYVNPRMIEKEIYLPTSYLIYKFFSRRINLDSVKWMAVLGTIADYGLKDTKDLIGKYLRKKDYENIWGSEYGRAAMIANSTIAIAGADKSLETLLQLKSFRQFKRNDVFRKAFEKFEKEFRKRKEEMMRRMEVYPKIGLRFTIINSKYFRRIASTLATRIGNKNRDSVFVILEKSGNIYRIHGRSTASDVSIAKLFKKLGVGGGHPAAGGGSIKVKELKAFRKSLIKEIEKMRQIDRKKR